VESPRLEELRRRVDEDPASIAFAQLAEECRRAGNHEEAIRVARAGLARHPDYVSARVTLGLALLASSRPAEARIELERASQQAPDNLAATRALLEFTSSGQSAAGSLDPTFEQQQPTPSRDLPAIPVPESEPALEWDPFPGAEEQVGLIDLVQDVDLHVPAVVGVPPVEVPPEDPLVGLDDWLASTSAAEASVGEPSGVPDFPVQDSRPEADPLAALDAWLDAIVADREPSRRRD
jgi:tetratricopeptide (TPR) repeat protein